MISGKLFINNCIKVNDNNINQIEEDKITSVVKTYDTIDISIGKCEYVDQHTIIRIDKNIFLTIYLNIIKKNYEQEIIITNKEQSIFIRSLFTNITYSSELNKIIEKFQIVFDLIYSFNVATFKIPDFKELNFNKNISSVYDAYYYEYKPNLVFGNVTNYDFIDKSGLCINYIIYPVNTDLSDKNLDNEKKIMDNLIITPAFNDNNFSLHLLITKDKYKFHSFLIKFNSNTNSDTFNHVLIKTIIYTLMLCNIFSQKCTHNIYIPLFIGLEFNYKLAKTHFILSNLYHSIQNIKKDNIYIYNKNIEMYIFNDKIIENSIY